MSTFQDRINLSRWRTETVVAVLLILAALWLAIPAGAILPALLVACLPLVVFVVMRDVARVGEVASTPWGLMAVVLLLPFSGFVFGTNTLQLLWQLVSVLVVLFYGSLLSPRARHAAVRASMPLLLVFGVLSACYALSLTLNGLLDARASVTVAAFALSSAYVLAGAVLRMWTGSAERANRVLVWGGLLQLLLAVASYTGLNSILQQLSIDPWGQSDALLRYRGSFGDYELFAEWMGVLFILAVGGAVYTSGRTQIVLALSSAALFGMGVLSVTRGFAVAVVLAVVVVVPAALLRQRGRGLLGLVAAGAAATAAIAFVVPRATGSAMLARLLNSKWVGALPANRADIFSIWNAAIARMPWYGYGWGSSTLRQAFGFAGVDYPHSAYYYFLLSAGWPALAAFAVLIVAVLWCVRPTPARDSSDAYRLLVVGAAISYWVLSELKIEFVRAPFYVNLVLVLFGILAADRWSSMAAHQESQSGSSAPG